MDVTLNSWSTAHGYFVQQCLAGVSVGVLSHVLYFIRGYHDTQALGIFVAHAATYIALTVSFGLRPASIIFSSYLISLFTSIGAYRIFFHPLRQFPGPVVAKITKFYGPYTARNGQMHIEQNKLFKKSGDIVRIGNSNLTQS